MGEPSVALATASHGSCTWFDALFHDTLIAVRERSKRLQVYIISQYQQYFQIAEFELSYLRGRNQDLSVATTMQWPPI